LKNKVDDLLLNYPTDAKIDFWNQDNQLVFDDIGDIFAYDGTYNLLTLDIKVKTK